MSTFTIYLNDEEQTEIEIVADAYEIKDNYVHFKYGIKEVGFFKLDAIIGIEKDTPEC